MLFATVMVSEVPDNPWFCQGQVGSEASRLMEPGEAQQ